MTICTRPVYRGGACNFSKSHGLYIQGVHSTGKPGKVREFGQIGKNLEKSGNFEEKMQGISEKKREKSGINNLEGNFWKNKNYPSFFFFLQLKVNE